MPIYENPQYFAINGVVVNLRCDINGVTWWIPLDPANTDYANIMQLVAEGKLTIAPASP